MRCKPLLDLAELLGSWELHPRAERKSAETLTSYGNGVRAHLAWCERARRPAVVDRHQLRAFVVALLAEGAKPSTVLRSNHHSPSAMPCHVTSRFGASRAG